MTTVKRGRDLRHLKADDRSVILLLDIFIIYMYIYLSIYIMYYIYTCIIIYIHNMCVCIYIYISSNKKCGRLVLNPHTLWHSNMAVCRLCRELARSEQRTEVPSRPDTSPPAIGPQSLRIAMS